MGDTHLPNPEGASYELALANRKLVTVVMGMTLLMGLVACLAYLAGRSVTGIRAERSVPIVAPPPVVVEAPAAPAPKATVPAAPAPAAKVAAPPVAPQPAAPVASPSGPQLYLQVAAGSPADLAPLQKQLAQRDLPLQIVQLDDKHRLLVGPVRDSAQQKEFEKRLAEAGKQYFPRRL